MRARYKTEDFIPSIIKNCKTLIEQTHTKPQETLEFGLTEPGESFSFIPCRILVSTLNG